MEDLNWMPATKLRELIANGSVSVVSVVEACLSQIDRLEPDLHAFITVDREGALAAAERADAAVQSGTVLGPLHGIPVALKDDLWAAGMPATFGSLLFSKFVPSRDDTVARRLREAGAIILGKTNLPEFVSWPRTRSFVCGESRNPWDRSRIPGASSGGSGVAVAAGMVSLAIGTDGGGSVRLPAAFCGIAGLLPTIGRVPAHGGFQCSPVSTAGPMARSIEELALLQSVIAGPEPATPWALPDAAPDILSGLDQGVAGLRAAWSADYGHIPVASGIVEAAKIALQALGAAGAQVSEIDDHLPHPWGDGQVMAGVIAASADAGEAPFPEGSIPESNFAEEGLRACTERAEGYFTAPGVGSLMRDNAGLLPPHTQLLMRLGQGQGEVPSDESLHAAMDAIF